MLQNLFGFLVNDKKRAGKICSVFDIGDFYQSLN